MAGMWSEVSAAKKENRRELNLHGQEISERIERDGFDEHVFDLINLNYLDVRKTCLSSLSTSVGKLANLGSLVLHNNQLTSLPEIINTLTKLKVLDVSSNKIEAFPSLEGLTLLNSVNASRNQITQFPSISSLTSLHILNLSQNSLTALPDGIGDVNLEYLAEVIVDNNCIEEVTPEMSNLVRLHTLDLSFNKLTDLPPELSECPKLKEFNVKGNKFKDRKMIKLVENSHGKSVLNHLGILLAKEASGSGKKGGKKKKKGKTDTTADDDELTKDLIDVLRFPSDKGFTIQVKPAVICVRPYLVCCIVRKLDFQKNATIFKKFIALQTKLHDTICEKRQAATIATHDMKALQTGLVYDARFPNEIRITPLFKSKETTAADLVAILRKEADALRKEKKRSTISGVHKYLDLLKDKVQYPCLVDSNNQVISFPPITNSDKTKISSATTDILIEVTSSTSLDVCKKVADELLYEMLLMGVGASMTEDVDEEATACSLQKLVVEQVKVIDVDGGLRVVYPSRTDLPLSLYNVNRE